VTAAQPSPIVDPPGPTPSEVRDFLVSFFSPPNTISLADIIPGGQAAHLVSWVERLRGASPLSTVFPCRRNGHVCWYGLAFSDSQLRALGDQMLAFVGPTYSTFRGHRALLDPADPIEEAIARLTGGFAFKFTGTPAADKPKPIWDALELMRTVGGRRPDRVLDVPMTTGRVLRDFHMALRARNAASADRALRYLADERRLTPSNVLFLRIQALAEMGEWDALLARPEMPDLLQMRRPLAITEALLRAVYRRELASFEQKRDPRGAAAHFRSIVLTTYGTLFVRRAGMRAPEALKALMLLAIAGEPADPELRDTVWATRGVSEDDRLYLKQLSDLLPSTIEPLPELAPLQAAVSAREGGDYERAYVLALEAPASSSRARLLVECAYELQTLDAERSAISALATLTPESRAEALRGRRLRELYNTFADVEAERQQPTSSAVAPSIPVESIPGNWIEWLERVARDEEWTGGLDVARRGAREWSVEDLLLLPNVVGRLTDLLLSSSGAGTVQNALPQFVAFLERDVLWPRPEFAKIYGAVLDLLAIGSTGSEDDVRVYVHLAQSVLELGLEKKAYGSMLSDIRHLLVNFPSPGRIAWGLEMLEATVTQPCPDEDARLGLMLDVAELLNKFRRRADEAQRAALGLLCHDLGQTEMFDSLLPHSPGTESSALPTSDILSQLNGKSVTIYTLTERAGRYMKQILADRAPQASVQLAHDKVGSDSLRNLARRADVFIMATASSTHAATGFIEANRPSDRPLIRPGGKGMASMLYALEEFLRTEAVEEPFALSS
jgi:hypothetical protein